MIYCFSRNYAVCPQCKTRGKAFYVQKYGSNGSKVKCRLCGKDFQDVFGYSIEEHSKLTDDAIFDSTDYPPSHA